MPFTPVHMGPGLLIKAMLQSSFSLMVFGWSQIVMDIQPLIVLITGEGHLHGFTHTYIGATLLGIFAGVSGKYLSEIGLGILHLNPRDLFGIGNKLTVSWWVAMLSALLGSFSHVMLDSIMHSDLQPFSPFNLDNDLLGIISVNSLHQMCLYSGVVGAVVYYILLFRHRKRG